MRQAGHLALSPGVPPEARSEALLSMANETLIPIAHDFLWQDWVTRNPGTKVRLADEHPDDIPTQLHGPSRSSRVRDCADRLLEYVRRRMASYQAH
jgi:hypothetical protein